MADNSMKDTILQATLDAIAENTISETGMRLIANKAGIAQSNLHYYFATKKDLLLAELDMIQNRFETERRVFFTKSEPTLEGQLKAFFDQEMDVIRRMSKYIRVRFDYWTLAQIDQDYRVMFQENYQIWHNDIMRVLHAYLDIDDQRAETVAFSVVSMLLGACMQYLTFDATNVSLEDYFSYCHETTLKSLEGFRRK